MQKSGLRIFSLQVELKQAIINHLGENVNAVGFAPIDRFNNAPEMHHPANACRDARTVIVFGITVCPLNKKKES
jgi:hypothetical protein